MSAKPPASPSISQAPRSQRDLNSPERIVEVAFALAQTKGSSSLTNRKIAEYADISPSAITYHFGGISQLRARVAEATHAAMDRWRHRHRPTISGLASATPAGLVIAALFDLAVNYRGLALLHAEFLDSPDALGFIELERDSVSFWMRAFEKMGCSIEQVTSWVDLLYGLVSLVLLDTAFSSLASWLPILIHRFDDRLNRRPILEPMTSPFPPPASYPAGPTASGAQKILDAAVAIIAHEGFEKLTHRSVAAKAGLSVAATTYFFESKTELIIGALHEIRRKGEREVEENLNTLSTSGYLLSADGKAMNPLMLACRALHAPVARRSELQSVRVLVRDMRGPAGLLRLRHEGFDADRLDAVIWSSLMFGAIHPLRIPGRNVIAELEERTDLHRHNLFGSPVARAG